MRRRALLGFEVAAKTLDQRLQAIGLHVAIVRLLRRRREICYSIILSHSLIPEAMEHMFAGYAAMLAPDLPLTRRQQEMIATTVAALNRCFH